MSDHDFDTNGPGEEELRNLLRSMPQKQAPDNLEPELMRRLDGMRRRRGLFGVFHAAARTDWIGGVISAASAAAVVAGTWLAIDPAMPVQTPAPAAPTTIERPAPSTIVVPPSSAPATLATPSTSRMTPATTITGSKRVAVAAPSRRSATTAPTQSRRRTASVRQAASEASVATIDTVTAARLRSRADTPTFPSSSEAGVHPQSPATVPPLAPSSGTDSAPTGVDTGARRR